MAEDIKERIMKLFLEFPDEKFSVKQIQRFIGVSYPTLLKWVQVLYAERKLRIDDYGNIKLVYLNKEMKHD